MEGGVQGCQLYGKADAHSMTTRTDIHGRWSAAFTLELAATGTGRVVFPVDNPSSDAPARPSAYGIRRPSLKKDLTRRTKRARVAGRRPVGMAKRTSGVR